MKTPCLAVVLLVSTAVGTYGQVAGANTPATTAADATAVQTKPTPYAVVERGANHQVWQSTTYETMPTGRTVSHTHTYIELATGLNFWDGTQWQASREQIDILPQGGAASVRGQHKVYFPSDIYNGVITMIMPDGKQLKSQVVGLGYSDGRNSVLIATITNSAGRILPSGNQVIYPNAFAGGITASIRYTYTKDSFEQDVLLESQLPAPEKFGFSPDTAFLEVITEFFDPPPPVIKEQIISSAPGLEQVNQDLSFDAMKMGQGRAFVLGEDQDASGGIPVAKEWVQVDGRQFLFEQIPMAGIQDMLKALPAPRQSSIKSTPGVARRMALGRRILPQPRLAQANTNVMKMAEVNIFKGALVLDYTTLNTTLTNYTFQGDLTYFLSGNISLYGTKTVFEGGTVIKYASNVTLTVNTPVTWLGDNYRPVVMTAKDDNRVGEAISGSTGSPGTKPYAATALYFNSASANTNLMIRNLRVANAKIAVALSGNGGHVLSHVQLLNCGNGIAATNTDFSLRNALFFNVQTNFTGSSATGRVEHLTADMAKWLNQDIGTNLFLTNCLLVAVTNTGSYTAQNVNFTSSGTGVFQSVGAADHYLVSGSTNRDIGTINVSGSLLSDLRKMTTYPPIVISNTTIAASTDFNIQAQRDTNTLDLGYHYDPIDYFFGGVRANSNVTFAAGAVVGWFELPGNGGPGYGLSLPDNVMASFNGTATVPCTFARYDTVQEGGNGLWKDKGWLAGIIGTGATYPGQASLKFTHCALLAGDPNVFRDYYGYCTVVANNCEFWSGCTGGYGAIYYLTNCLLDRFYLGLNCDCGTTFPSLIMQNGTMHGGTLFIQHWSSTVWPVTISDSAFDSTSISVDDYSGGSTLHCDYNAYTNTTNPFPTGGSHDVQGVIFNWQSGPFGNYYLAQSSPLVNAGSRTADLVGLYHFTTQTSQIKETNSTVDIGYHYVAIGPAASGLVGYWALDDGAGSTAIDASVYNNNGTLVSGPTWSAGRIGPASLSFDGSYGYLTISNSAALEVGQSGADISVTYWLFLRTGYTGAWRNLMHKGVYDSDRTFAMWMCPSDNKLYYRISTTYSWDEGGSTTAAVPLNQWVHVAYIKSGNKLRLYFNGSLDSEVTLAGSSVANAGPIYFGKDPWYAGTNCRLDDIRIYARALDGIEIASLANEVIVPIDTDGDGIPDYLEDANGNGVVDTGESSWILNFYNGLSFGNGLQVFTPLK
jgi:Concanavalin A-like lectin/glucanases superfamily